MWRAAREAFAPAAPLPATPALTFLRVARLHPNLCPVGPQPSPKVHSQAILPQTSTHGMPLSRSRPRTPRARRMDFIFTHSPLLSLLWRATKSACSTHFRGMLLGGRPCGSAIQRLLQCIVQLQQAGLQLLDPSITMAGAAQILMMRQRLPICPPMEPRKAPMLWLLMVPTLPGALQYHMATTSGAACGQITPLPLRLVHLCLCGPTSALLAATAALGP